RTVVSALRLEAHGTGSVDVFKAGLEQEEALVRFCSAEALAYLGDPACGEVLAKMVEEQPALRAFSLTAMASLDETICHVRLRELLGSNSAETRYGAFRALREMQDEDPGLQGVEYNESFWVHRVAPESTSLVHLSLQRRPEVVLFGKDIKLVPPFSILAGEFTITAGDYDKKCTLSRISVHTGVQRRQCGLGVEEVLAEMGKLGANYPNVVEFLQKSGNCQCLTAAVRVDALPTATSVYELASKNADNLIDEASEPQILNADLGATPTLFERADIRKGRRGTASSEDAEVLLKNKKPADKKSARTHSIWE
ncbi:MAG: HEAT repeat domain-containing protein, partial [Gemmataceae bacterium]